MAQTQLHNYSVQEKLNKMDVDIITITATLTADDTDGDIMFINTEIPNAVAVKGGTCIIHSISAVLANNSTDGGGSADGGSALTNSFRLVFTNDDTFFMADGTTAIVASDPVGAVTLPRTTADGIQGFTDLAGVQDMGYFAVFSKTNVGIAAKAESDSTSLHVFGITQSADDYSSGTITLNIGIVKD